MDRLESLVELGDEELRTIVGGDEDAGMPLPDPEFMQKMPQTDGWKG